MKTTKIFMVFLLVFSLSSPLFAQQEEKPKVYAVSNAHFDSQWNWDVQTSIRDYVWNTLNQNLFLLSKYPDYIFNFEGGIKYYWMKEYYPDYYKELKNYVKQGRWHITGSTWDATDSNIPSPESFTRNILYGQLFYQDEFNTRGTDIFLPDCFGFGWTLPTIAAHSGLIGFSTQKLQWRSKPFYGDSKIPFNIGLWKGVDGAKIMLVADAHNYTTRWNDEDISQNKGIIDNAMKSPLKVDYHYYGTGDTGGSPTIGSVRSIEKGLKGDGPVQIISATSDQLYKDFLPYDKHPELPVYTGELLMDVHGTGCYTSQAAMKLYNRNNELLADAAERAAVTADWMGTLPYPDAELSESWKRFIWHQFHDDLTGTSIPRAYEFSWNDELLSQKQFAQVLTASAGNIARQLNTQVSGIPLLINNPIAQRVKEVVEVTVDMPKVTQAVSVYNEKGQKVPSQLISYQAGKATLLLSADVAPVSFTVYEIRNEKSNYPTTLNVSARTIENSIYKLTLNNNGDIASIIDKRNEKELVQDGKAVRLALFTENESFNWPAWEILKTTIDRTPIDITDDVIISVVENGPVRSTLCVKRKYNESTFKQYISLTNGGQDDRIDIRNVIDWHTTNALLKAEFPLRINNEEARYDLGVGSVLRKNNTDIAYEVHAQQWADLTESDLSYGVSIMNNGKYGWDKPDNNTLRLTLLHTPKTRNGYIYQDKQDFGRHEFTYSLMGHTGSFTDAATVLKAEILNQTPKAFVVEKHKGERGKEISFMQTNSSQIAVKALKKAEKSDAYIVRVYETTGKDAKNMELAFAGEIAEAKELNGVEDVIGNVTVQNNKITFDASPFAMKTFSVKLKSSKTKSEVPGSVPVGLKYNLKTATYNAFRREANFDGRGSSFAAELLPSKINSSGIEFLLGSPDETNGVKCSGDTVILPQDGTFNKLYVLAASTFGDNKATFYVDGVAHEFVVPYYSGFIGQWGHDGHTKGFLKPAEIAYTGTHKHAMMENKDVPYEFTYMFKFGMDIPQNAKMLIFPKNARIVVFAASLAKNTGDNIVPAVNLLKSSLKENNLKIESFTGINLLSGKKIIGSSGEMGRRGRAEFAIDEQLFTRWSDNGDNSPKYIEIDMEKQETIKGWIVAHSGTESPAYITKAYRLEVKNNPDDPWKTVDSVSDNTENETDRLLPTPVSTRYIRLTVVKPEQGEGNTARINDFEVY